MKPLWSLDGSDVPLAYVINNVYPNDDIRDVLTTIDDTSTMRETVLGGDKEEMKKKGFDNYKLRTPNSY